MSMRRRLPTDRAAIVHEFSIDGLHMFVRVSCYPDGAPGEIFIDAAKEGSTLAGLFDGLATMISLSLQHGVPLQTIAEKLEGHRFPPSAWIGGEFYPSMLDYLGRWMRKKFLGGTV